MMKSILTVFLSMIICTLLSADLFAGGRPQNLVKPTGPTVPQVISPEHDTRAWSVRKLPDTGQQVKSTDVFGSDTAYSINTPSFTDNENNTITDNITGIMWQKISKGDNSFDQAVEYCKTLNLAGYENWRLPDIDELYNLINLDRPPINSKYFLNEKEANTHYSSTTLAGDDSRVWGINRGGGIGAYPKSEPSSVSAERRRTFNTRCVRDTFETKKVKEHFSDNKDNTVRDNSNGLVWQQAEAGEMAWEDALRYCENLSLGGKDDWRLPNVKESRSMCDYTLYSPSVDLQYFPGLKTTWHWTSSTTQRGRVVWYINYVSSSATYSERTEKLEVRCVRGGF
jgi:hypothetical protein